MTAKKGFEAALKRLEEAVDQLEGGELPLERALKVFSEGVKQAGICRQSLNEVELQVEQLLKQTDGSLERETFNEQS